jgi:ATP-dependent DNA helicase PIF1
MLAFSISTHKSQGMTLDRVQMKLANVWECGQVYVALSRASTTAGLHLINYDPYSIRADSAVIAFHRNMYEEQLDNEQ